MQGLKEILIFMKQQYSSVQKSQRNEQGLAGNLNNKLLITYENLNHHFPGTAFLKN